MLKYYDGLICSQIDEFSARHKVECNGGFSNSNMLLLIDNTVRWMCFKLCKVWLFHINCVFTI